MFNSYLLKPKKWMLSVCFVNVCIKNIISGLWGNFCYSDEKSLKIFFFFLLMFVSFFYSKQIFNLYVIFALGQCNEINLQTACQQCAVDRGPVQAKTY